MNITGTNTTQDLTIETLEEDRDLVMFINDILDEEEDQEFGGDKDYHENENNDNEYSIKINDNEGVDT